MKEGRRGIFSSAVVLLAIGLAVPPLRAQPAQAQPAQAQPAQAQPAQAPPVQGAPPPGLPTLGIAPAPAPAPAPPPAWLPRHTAVLQIVEKVDATHRSLSVPVGSTAKLGTLTIAVKACVVRPPGQERDAAAYLEIAGKDKAAPLFQGWMLAAEPAVSVFQDPIYDVRVTGCD